MPLSMADIPKRSRVRVRQVTPEPMRMAEQPRGRTPAVIPVKDKPVPVKILTISDLPKRNSMAKTITSKPKPTVRASAKLLGPKVFSEYVRDGAWKGRRCFIVGGGPSVKQVDLSLLRGELTIGINRAYELFDPSILFGVDGQMWGWVEQGKLGEESKAKFNAYKGYKAWMAIHKVYPPDFYLIDVDDTGGYRIGRTARLAFKNNSGYGAINLAAALGANPIYLIGFDMHGDRRGKQKWWHDGYPVDYGEGVYGPYIDELGKFAPVLKQAGFDVINLNPKSALKCFTFGKYTEVVKSKPVIPAGAIQAMTRPGMITAVTPTGDRPLAFALCVQWMESQTVSPDQWVVVDDGKVPTKAPAWATYIRRAPRRSDPPHTLSVNLKTAIPHITGDKIIIIEDDEYYGPKYVETLSKKLDEYEVVGINCSKYYHLPSGGKFRHGNIIHASLAQTSFRSSFLPELSKLVSHKIKHYLDICLWAIAMQQQRGYLFGDEKESLYAGIKGLPGRSGIGVGHDVGMYGKKFDVSRELLRKWIPKDHKVYMDILSGKLTTENVGSYFPKITGITVCQNTKELIQRAYESVRKFHPDMPIIIVDGSDTNNPCAAYVRSLRSDVTTVVQPGYNIGHGKGMCMGIDMATTPYALMFDSDIEMLKSPLDAMLAMAEPDTFGVGYIEKTDFGGYDSGARPSHNKESMAYLHPYFQLINIANYRKFPPYVHHGAPCYLTMLDIHEQGLSSRVLKEFPGLGHSAGKGLSWDGKKREYIRHDTAGTRSHRVRKGKKEIEGNWVYK